MYNIIKPIFSLIVLALTIIPTLAIADGGRINIGAIIDESCRSGKEERVAMEIAAEDFYGATNQTILLNIKNSQGQPKQATLAAQDLIRTKQVQAILGLEKWEEVTQVADLIHQNYVPILSFCDFIPNWKTGRYPFLLQVSSSKKTQMKAIAAIIQSWNWHQVSVLYEDSISDGIIPYLYDSLKEVGSEINRIITLSRFNSVTSLTKDLDDLKHDDCRVFVVHGSLSLALRLFQIAKEMNMMERDYVWITTDPITSLVHSLDSSAISSMQGIIGVKAYFSESDRNYQNFYKQFRTMFSRIYPEENNHEPGIHALQAYNALKTIALASDEGKYKEKELLDRILLSDFLSGKIKFNEMKIAPAYKYQIINVIGKSYGELGFWSNGLGFSKTINTSAIYSSSMDDLGQAIWPGGWTLPTSSNKLRIGVPAESGFKEYVKLENNTFSGFSIEVLKETLKNLPFNLEYEFVPFYGTYNDLVQGIHLKKFEAVVGDVSIVSHRFEHAEFTYPYTGTGLVKIVPTRPSSCNAWLFLKPFTKLMWVLIVAINIYSGFVVWFIERNYCDDLKGSIINQIGVLFWLSFTTLFSLHGEKLHNNLSRVSMVVWLFMALVITQTYTANLASVLTVERLEPYEVHEHAMIGYCGGSFIKTYLEDVLHYNQIRLKSYSTIEEYGQAFINKEIAAAYIEAPLAKLFFAKYCKGYTIVGPTYKIGGFGFAFRRVSPLLPSMNEALLKVAESGKLLELENNLLSSNDKCKKDLELEDGENQSLGPGCFRVLFMTTGGTSTVALVLFIFHKLANMLGHTSIWKLMWYVLKHLRLQRRNLLEV